MKLPNINQLGQISQQAIRKTLVCILFMSLSFVLLLLMMQAFKALGTGQIVPIVVFFAVGMTNVYCRWSKRIMLMAVSQITGLALFLFIGSMLMTEKNLAALRPMDALASKWFGWQSGFVSTGGIILIVTLLIMVNYKAIDELGVRMNVTKRKGFLGSLVMHGTLPALVAIVVIICSTFGISMIPKHALAQTGADADKDKTMTALNIQAQMLRELILLAKSDSKNNKRGGNGTDDLDNNNGDIEEIESVGGIPKGYLMTASGTSYPAAWIERLRRFENMPLATSKVSGIKKAADPLKKSVQQVGYGITNFEIEEAIKAGYLKAGTKLPTSMTKAEADQWMLDTTIPTYEGLVRQIVKVKLNRAQMFALVSFCHNLGQGSLREMVTQKGRLNDGNYEDTPSFMERYCCVKNGKKVTRPEGLAYRRFWECGIFASGFDRLPADFKFDPESEDDGSDKNSDGPAGTRPAVTDVLVSTKTL